MNEHIIKYDKQKRIVYECIPDLNIEYTYSYRNSFRLNSVESPYNNTNYKTVILEIMIDNSYLKIKKTDYGVKYKTIKKYCKNGRRFFFKRVDIIRGTYFIERIIRNKLGIPVFWFEERIDSKNFGFKISNKILKALTFKK